MNQSAFIETDRLLIRPLSIVDDDFILELVNSEGWLRFIGDREVGSIEDARAYIHKILDAKNVDYWVVRSIKDHQPIGVVTYISKEYLDFPDIGFAFLPAFGGLGYALEASRALRNWVLTHTETLNVCATTVPENVKSIRLLGKLGFQFQKTMEYSGTMLSVYELTEDRVAIERIILRFFSVFDNRNGRVPNMDSLREVCNSDLNIYKKTEKGLDRDTLDSFIETRQELFNKGVFSNFQESETASQSTILGNIAQRQAFYRKSWTEGEKTFYQKGTKLFQLVKNQGSWQICALIWEDEPASEQKL